MFSATTWILIATLAGAWAPPSQDAPPAPAQESELSPYDALHAEFDAAMKAWSERYAAAETDESRKALFAEYPSNAFVPRFRALAEEHAGTPTALQAWRFVLRMGAAEHLDAALAALSRDFVGSAEIGDVCIELRTIVSAARDLFAKVLEENPHAGARGKACYALAGLVRDRASLAAKLEDMDADERAVYERYYGAPTFTELEGQSPAALRAEAEKLFERVAADFAGVQVRGKTLGDMAAGDLYELRHLQVGMRAPEIEGEDVDGVRFRLSDSRGKVVVLGFWGDW